jgi:hypothetical protein
MIQVEVDYISCFYFHFIKKKENKEEERMRNIKKEGRENLEIFTKFFQPR